jgi:predicted RNase H-like nuclease (RuvC/YqgF family)
MGKTEGLGLIVYTGSRSDLERKLRARDDRITELEARMHRIERDIEKLADELEGEADMDGSESRLWLAVREVRKLLASINE